LVRLYYGGNKRHYASSWTMTKAHASNLHTSLGHLQRSQFPLHYSCSRPGCINVRNKPVARTSTGMITFGHGPAARVAVVSVNELSPYPGRAAIEQLASSWLSCACVRASVAVSSLARVLRVGVTCRW
jgi:hypothetical protein